MPDGSESPDVVSDVLDSTDPERSKRVGSTAQSAAPKGKIKIQLPRNNRPIGDFCEELAQEVERLFESNWIKRTRVYWSPNTYCGKAAGPEDPAKGCLWCVKAGVVGRIVITGSGNESEKVSFVPFKPEEFITAFDQHFRAMKMAQGGWWVATSINVQQAKIILSSESFRKSLPEIDRVFMYSPPIFVGRKQTNIKRKRLKELVMCPTGFGSYREEHTDQTVKFYCHRKWDASKNKMSLGEAKALLDRIYCDFKFSDERCRANALAHLLTPYCQNIIGARKKTPLWMFTADAPRSGKDYLAMISPIVHEGIAVQDPPLEDEAEFKRRITSAILAGRRFQHMANCRGAIDSPSLEAAVTSEFWSDRLIGTSQAPVLSNEIIFSLSFNGDPYLSADISLRARRVHLAKPDEPANKREFQIENLHAKLSSWEPLDARGSDSHEDSDSGDDSEKDSGSANDTANTPSAPQISRRNVLAALYSLVRNWVDKGHKPGKTFASFPEWAKVVGGIIEAAGYGSPTQLSALDLRSERYRDEETRAFGWFALREGGSELRTAGEIQQLLKAHDAELLPKDQLFSLVWGKDPSSFGKMLAAAAKRGTSEHFTVDCDAVSDATRPRYAIRLKEKDFLEKYADFAEVFRIPVKNPSDISLIGI